MLRWHLNFFVSLPYFRSLLHDEEKYPEPFKFNPDRFMTGRGQLDASVWDPEEASWGYGRRYVFNASNFALQLLSYLAVVLDVIWHSLLFGLT